KGIINITNEFAFTNLKDIKFTWEIIRNGEKIKQGNYSVVSSPLSNQDIMLNLPDVEVSEGNEYYLNVYAYSIQSTDLVPAGHLLAYEQLAFDGNNYFPVMQKDKSGSKPTVTKKNNKIEVKAGD